MLPFAIPLLVALLGAQVDADIDLGDSFSGTILTNVDADLLRFSALGGARITVEVKAKGDLKPDLALIVEESGQQLAIDAFTSGGGKKKVKLAKFPLPATGTYLLRVVGRDGTTGGYGMKTKVEVTKAITSQDAVVQLGAGALMPLAFEAPAGAKVTLSAKAPGKSKAKPKVAGLEGPDGPVGLDPYLQNSGATAKKVPIETTGGHVFTLANNGAAGAIAFELQIALKKGGAKHAEPSEPVDPGAIEGTVSAAPLLAIPELPGPNDTVATSQYVGELAGGEMVRVAGTIESETDFDAWRFQVDAPLTLDVTLIHDALGDDFDLGVYSVAQNGYLSPTLETAAEPAAAQVEIPAAGTYLFVVWPHDLSGAGNPYLVTAIASAGSATAAFAAVPADPVRPRPAGASPEHLLELDREFVAGEIVLKLRDAHADRRAFASAHGLDVRLESPDGTFVAAPRAVASRLALVQRKEELRRLPEVELAELNHVMRPAAIPSIPDDPLFPLQWHYAQIGLPQAWDVTKGSPNVVVAVVDTGFAHHPDLMPRIDGGFDFVADPLSAQDGDGYDADATDPGDHAKPDGSSTWHGTHVAGTIGAATGNGAGGAGVDQACRLRPLRAVGKFGGTDFDVAQAIRYAAALPNASGKLPAHRANVVNLSLQGAGFSQTVADACAAARAAGSTLVAAAGNFASAQPSYPAAYPGVIGVAAVGAGDAIAAYSNSGPSIDLAAPGGDTSADLTGDGYPDGVLSTSFDDAHHVFSQDLLQGTSMAAPHVAGVAALLLSLNPSLSPDQVEALIESTAVDLGPPGPDATFGAGRLDAFAAVKAAALSGAPQLALSSADLEFGSAVAQLAFVVVNAGSGTLAYTLADAEDSGGDWLALGSAGGNLAGGASHAIVASVDRSGLAPGTYAATISIASNAGAAAVHVAMSVSSGGPPQLLLSTGALDFGAAQAALPLVAQNSGGGDLALAVAVETTPAGGTWLGTSGLDGVALAAGASAAGTLVVDRSGLAPGAYAGTVEVSSAGGTKTVQVAMTVAPSTGPLLALSAGQLDFGVAQSVFAVQVQDAGAGGLAFNATDQEDSGGDWLSIAPASGGAPQSMQVTVDRTGLAPGHYTGTVDVASNGGNAAIAVAMDVALATPQPIDLGPIFVVAVRPQDMTVLAATTAAGSAWSLASVPLGGALVFGGPDLDHDGFVCGPGEPCGVWLGAAEPQLVIVESGATTPGIDFAVADVASPALFGLQLALPPHGFATGSGE